MFLKDIGGTDIDNSGVDTDGDGLSDKLEKSGLRNGYGVVRKTDPENPDTDGDGIFDGEEVGLVNYSPQEIEDCVIEKVGIVEENGGKFLKFLSDPKRKDSDMDGVHDLIEIEYGSNPKNKDTDGDGLNDKIEHEIGTDPKIEDTDGDGANDKKEYNSLLLDPLSPDKYITTGKYIEEFCKGFILGDAIENPDSINMVGAIVGNLWPGVGTVADVRDMLVNFFKEDYVMAGANLAGILPMLGDSAQVISKLSKYLENLKYSDEAMDALNTVIKLGDKVIPNKAQLMLIEKLLVTGLYADVIIDFFDIRNTYDNNGALKNAAEILNNILSSAGKSDITLETFIKSVKILNEKGVTRAYPNIGKLLEEAAKDSKLGDKFAEQFLEEVAIKQKHLTAIMEIPEESEAVKKSLVSISNRIKGYLGEFTLHKKLKTHNYKLLNINKNKVNTTGADLVALVKNKDGKDILYIAEAKAWSNNVGERGVKNYFDKEFLNIDYAIKDLSDDDRNSILDMLSKEKLEVKFELWLFRPAGAKNEGITKSLKNSIFGGENGKLSNNLKITDEWDNIAKAKIKELDGKTIEIKNGYSVIEN